MSTIAKMCFVCTISKDYNFQKTMSQFKGEVNFNCGSVSFMFMTVDLIYCITTHKKFSIMCTSIKTCFVSYDNLP